MYLNEILAKYTPRKLNPLSLEIISLNTILTRWAGVCLIEILPSGSFAKGTAISLSSDYDYLISLKSDCNSSIGGLESIYTSLGVYLRLYYSNVRAQNVSYRVVFNGLEIDITPARLQAGYNNWHSIYVSKLDTWQQTNIQQHINDISNSGRTNEMKLLKIWRELHDIEFPSIYLEYLTKRILSNKPLSPDALADNFEFLLRQLALEQGNPLNHQIIDPSNSSNVLSALISSDEKKVVERAARASIETGQWKNIVW